jgi:branched-subunit amino acid transport protein
MTMMMMMMMMMMIIIIITKMIPVIIGATGTISKTFRKYVSNIPGKT